MNDDDNLVFYAGVIFFVTILIGVFGAIGPIFSDWILK